MDPFTLDRLLGYFTGGQTPVNLALGRLFATNPEQAIPALAQGGVEPPDITGGTEVPLPRARPPMDIRPEAVQGGFYGGSPETNPNLAPVGGAAPKGPDLLKTLQGIKAPPAPDVQRVSTPHPLAGRTPPNNPQMMQMLLAAMQGGAGDVKPMTLASAIPGIPTRRGY